MAIIRSHSMWGARKSAGGITYRQDRGRTIASQKRGPQPKTRGDLVLLYREGLFGVISAAARVLSMSINNSFDKTKFGSRRNNFFKKNYKYFEQLVQAPLAENGGRFVEVLKSFGLETGQTIIAGLQQGIIDLPAVEIAMKESGDNGVYSFMAFATWSQNTGSTIAYVRSDIDGEYITATALEPWDENESVLDTLRVTSMIVTTNGTEGGMRMTKVSFTGRNLEYLKTDGYKIWRGGTEMPGTWADNGSYFTIDTESQLGQAASKVDTGQTVNLFVSKEKTNSPVIARTSVYGSQSGVTGE